MPRSKRPRRKTKTARIVPPDTDEQEALIRAWMLTVQHFFGGKVFYFLLQIAHLLSQLIEKGSLVRSAIPVGVGSAKNLAFRLLETTGSRHSAHGYHS